MKEVFVKISNNCILFLKLDPHKINADPQAPWLAEDQTYPDGVVYEGEAAAGHLLRVLHLE